MYVLQKKKLHSSLSQVFPIQVSIDRHFADFLDVWFAMIGLKE